MKLEIKKMKRLKKNELGVSPVIAVILMVAITVVLAGVLWAALTGIVVPDDPSQKITGIKTEKSFGWQIDIVSVSGNSIKLEDIKLQVISGQGSMEYEIDTTYTNPTPFLMGESIIYTLTKGSSVEDNSTGMIVSGDSRFEDFEGCYIALVDQDANEKLTSGDNIYIFKDYNGDNTYDITSNYEFKIKIGSNTAFSKKL
jgi:flagellin-like protein